MPHRVKAGAATAQPDVRDRRRGRELDALPAGGERAEVAEEPFAAAEQDRHHATWISSSSPARGTAARRDAAAQTHVPLAGRRPGALQRGLDPVGHEVERRPPAIGCDGRAWWVSTNTSWWNGGSAPHQPAHPGSFPRAAHRAEHVAAHDRGPDVRRAPVAEAPIDRRGVVGEDPFVQPLTVDAERELVALVGPAPKPSREMLKLCARSSVMQRRPSRSRTHRPPLRGRWLWAGRSRTLAVLGQLTPPPACPGSSRGSALPW